MPLTKIPFSMITGVLNLIGGTLTGLFNQSAGANIASVATVNLTLATGNSPRITGVVATSAFTMNIGQQMWLVADGAWPLTYNATTNKINGGVSVTLSAGDRIFVFRDFSGIIQTTVFKADGTAVASVKFSAYAAANQTAVSGALTKVVFGTEDFDIGGYFASSRFTPLVAGYYQINFNVGAATDAANGTVIGLLYKNGIRYSDGSYSYNQVSSNNVSSGSSLVSLNGSTDYVEIYVIVEGTIVNGAASFQTRFSGFLT